MTAIEVVRQALDAVRQATDQEISAIEVELAAAHAMATARRQALLVAPVVMASVPVDEPDYTPAEVAKILGLSRDTIYDMCMRAHDAIPSKLYGARRRRIPRKAFRAWHERQSR